MITPKKLELDTLIGLAILAKYDHQEVEPLREEYERISKNLRNTPITEMKNLLKRIKAI